MTFLRALVLVALLSTVTVAAAKFRTTWASPDAVGVSFAGKTVVALVISQDDNLRVSAEEALARELSALGVRGLAAYRVIPREEVRDPAKARGWFERSGAEGVVAMRLVSADQERTYVPGVWSTPYYSSFWGYYGYGWGAVYDPGYVREDTVVVIETLVYGVADGKLLWGGVSESTNPKTAGRLLHDLVEETVKSMRKQGLGGRASPPK